MWVLVELFHLRLKKNKNKIKSGSSDPKEIRRKRFYFRNSYKLESAFDRGE